MSVKIAKTAGFCYGVKRAVEKTYDAVKTGGKISTLGPLIHNRQVVEDLERRGVYAYDNIDGIPDDSIVIIRAHGVKKTVIDALQGKEYIDLTCPFVAKIHKIVMEQYYKGSQIVIVGDKNHPEVIGINGWCNDSAIITYDENFKMPEKYAEKPICIVAQTTINKKVFVQIVQNIKNTCKMVVVFDTICSATKDRQREAYELSAESDIMFVIGGKESSNTKKLYQIAREQCSETYFIESFEDIPQNIYIPKNSIVGITAGASTPPWMIKEVIGKMEEMLKDGEMSFAEALEQHEREKALVTLKTGDIVKGTVMRVESNGVSVNLGYKSDGFIP
ncbi:MAG: 4-hydroxy-3-methylbut-2-enyl diphosphate reductase, partial [Clostridiales bacterium]|nr:4-hydroxy-3-methylbut-2-enyl diphosphate reductase [Clostridiales bacterium]